MALRLVALASARHATSTYRLPRPPIEAPPGIQPAIEELQLQPIGLFYRYGDPPARITAGFSSGHTVELYLARPDLMHSVLRLPHGRAVKSSGEARRAGLPRVAILPQVAPLAPRETRLTPEYVRRMASTRLASQHLRNQLLVFGEALPRFRALVEESWSGLKVDAFEVPPLMDRDGELILTIRNQDFVAEIGTLGHGVQMWLQVMWFLAREQAADCVILDEPDVYMHPDLQRRLIRLLRRRGCQVVVTTHSSEMMAEVDPDDILVIDRWRPRSAFVSSLPAAQIVLESLGSAHNLQLARLWKARKFLLVEGDDVQVLKRLQDILFPESLEPLDAVPGMSIGGWSGWPRAVGSALTLQNAAGESIRLFCILDSDYFPPDTLRERYAEAATAQLDLHIWHKKELENYLLVPAAIARVISSRRLAGAAVAETEVSSEIARITKVFGDAACDALANECLASDRRLGLVQANRRARAIRDARFAAGDSESDLVSGKDVLSQLAAWSQGKWGVSFGVLAVAKEIRRGELAAEIVEVLEAIELNRDFPGPAVSGNH